MPKKRAKNSKQKQRLRNERRVRQLHKRKQLQHDIGRIYSAGFPRRLAMIAESDLNSCAVCGCLAHTFNEDRATLVGVPSCRKHAAAAARKTMHDHELRLYSHASISTKRAHACKSTSWQKCPIWFYRKRIGGTQKGKYCTQGLDDTPYLHWRDDMLLIRVEFDAAGDEMSRLVSVANLACHSTCFESASISLQFAQPDSAWYRRWNDAIRQGVRARTSDGRFTTFYR